MAQVARQELTRCVDGLTGSRKDIREIYDWFELGEREGFLLHTERVVAWFREKDAARWPLPCVHSIIRRWRIECYQLADSAFADAGEELPPVWPRESCYQGCAARVRLGPFLALEDGGKAVIWPHACEVAP